MTKHFAVVFLVGLVGCSGNDSWAQFERKRYPGPEVCATPVEEPKAVSIVELLARPEKYEGRAVRVIGFYRNEFEHSAIYLHREDAERSILANGFWVLGSGLSSLGNRYIAIEGIFTASSGGHLSRLPATVCGVVKATPWGGG